MAALSRRHDLRGTFLDGIMTSRDDILHGRGGGGRG